MDIGTSVGSTKPYSYPFFIHISFGAISFLWLLTLVVITAVVCIPYSGGLLLSDIISLVVVCVELRRRLA